MSVNYQTDSYILYNDSLCNNQLKHQELLVATLKQLADENKRLLKEREQFDDERLHRKSEINALKKNFIHLFTISQYEFNKSKFIESEFINECKTYDIISKRSEMNEQTFESINLLQELKIEFIYQLVKNNCKNVDYFHNFNNTFDCRPYKGPKTPPTPSSKYRYNEAIVNKVHNQNINCQTKLIDSWSVKEMICYLKKYKELFKIYKKSINQISCMSNNNKRQFQTTYNNIYDPNVFDKSNYINEKFVSNDMEFYQDLIEKHKKSLKMIENVGNRILPNLNLFEINTIPKENAVNNHLSKLFTTNNIRNQIFNDFTSKLILENSIALSDSNYSNDNNTMTFNETFNMIVPQQFSSIDSIIKMQNIPKDNIESENKELKIQENNFKHSTTENEIIINLKENVDSPNIFEDGEIIDSGDEISDKKTILKSDKITIIGDKEKTNKSAFKSMSSKLKKPIMDSKPKNNLTSVYSKYHKTWKIDKNKPNKIIKTRQLTFNENRNLKRESTHLLNYTELKTSRYCKDVQKTNLRNELTNYERSNKYFRHTRHYSPKY